MNRKDNINILERENDWDIIVIGGGATGLGIALDGVARNLKVLLLERGDFASETSSLSTKLVHGGIRYLQTLDFKNLLESKEEQLIMKRSASHLVEEIDFVLPVSGLWRRLYFNLGFKLYDFFVSRLSLKYSSSYQKAKDLDNLQVKEILPLINESKGIKYQDCQFDDSRFAINIAYQALKRGACILNYFEVISFIKNSGKVSGVIVKDIEVDREYKILSKVVINAAGPFSDEVGFLDNKNLSKVIDPVQGTHIVLPFKFIQGKTALIIPKTKRDRVFYAIPWMNRLLLGTTEVRLSNSELKAKALSSELDYLLEEYSLHFSLKPKVSDILSVFSGVRPLMKQEGSETGKHVSRDHMVYSTESGLINIIGGKWTTYRKMAIDAIDFAMIQGNFIKVPSQTLKISFCNNDSFKSSPSHLWQYGNNAKELEKLENDNQKFKELLHPDFSYTWSCVYWAVHHEMAIHLSDVLMRRTRILFLDAKAAVSISEKVAKFMAEELGKDNVWVKNEVEKFLRIAKDYLP